MFCSMIELCNQAKNLKMGNKSKTQASAAVKVDQFGRGYLSTCDTCEASNKTEFEINDYFTGNTSETN